LGGLPVEFIVKGHPRLPMARLLASTGPLPPWFTVSERPLAELFEEADVFLYTPPSSSALEAYLAGLPVLKYHDERQDGLLDIDSVEMASAAVSTCSRDTLTTELARLLRQDLDGAIGEDRQAALQRIYSPVNEQVWAALAGSGSSVSLSK
jgi:hypothetical protein